jgi:hypothetical protein
MTRSRARLAMPPRCARSALLTGATDLRHCTLPSGGAASAVLTRFAGGLEAKRYPLDLEAARTRGA